MLSALPTSHLYVLALPKGVLKPIDKFRKHCLWRGVDINSEKAPKAAWETVCATKEEGGLGVINLRKHKEALLLKNLDKFFNTKDIPWVSLEWEKHYSNGKLPNHIKKGSFWWRDILKLLDCYKSFSIVQVQNGQSCLLWLDKWNQQPLSAEFIELFSFARNRSITVSKFYSQQPLHDLFSLPLSIEAFQQLQTLQSIRDELLLTDQQDV